MKGVQLTVTVAAALSTTVQPVTRTQYCVVTEGLGLIVCVVPTGVLVFPDAPWYH